MDASATAGFIIGEHRRQYYVQVPESYRAFEEKHPAGFERALITMAAGLGRISGNPPGISALADRLCLSRTTIMREVAVPEAAGPVQRKRNGRRVLVLSTLDRATGEGGWPLADGLIVEGRERLKE